jgi:hypothetical protein
MASINWDKVALSSEIEYSKAFKSEPVENPVSTQGACRRKGKITRKMRPNRGGTTGRSKRSGNIDESQGTRQKQATHIDHFPYSRAACPATSAIRARRV